MKLLLLVAVLQFKGVMRQARYGLQLFVLPLMMLSIFLTAYLAVRMLSSSISELFYPFVVFILSATALNIPMQAGNQILSDQAGANLLVTPRGLKGLIIYFIGMQIPYLTTTLISIILAFILAHPRVYFLNSILGLSLLILWCLTLILIGLALGMRYLFAFHLAQFVFLSFYVFLLMLSITDRIEFAFLLPPVGIISIFERKSDLLRFFGVSISGIISYLAGGLVFVKWAYNEYRLGRGVNRV